MTVLQYHNQEIDIGIVLCAFSCVHVCIVVFGTLNTFKTQLKVFELLIDIFNI